MQLNSAEDREKYRIMLGQIDECMTRIEEQQDIIKEVLEAAEGMFGVEKKVTRDIAKALHKSNYEEIKQSFETFESLYELVGK